MTTAPPPPPLPPTADGDAPQRQAHGVLPRQGHGGGRRRLRHLHPPRVRRRRVGGACLLLTWCLAAAPTCLRRRRPVNKNVFPCCIILLCADDVAALCRVPCCCRCIVAFNDSERSWDCPCHGASTPDPSVLRWLSARPPAPLSSVAVLLCGYTCAPGDYRCAECSPAARRPDSRISHDVPPCSLLLRRQHAGSRFATNGNIIQGPATDPLNKVEVDW